MSVHELTDLEVVHRFSQALQEVDRLAAMRRSSRAGRNAATEAATTLRLDLGTESQLAHLQPGVGSELPTLRTTANGDSQDGEVCTTIGAGTDGLLN